MTIRLTECYLLVLTGLQDELEAIANSRAMSYVLTDYDELSRVRDQIVRHVNAREYRPGRHSEGKTREVGGGWGTFS